MKAMTQRRLEQLHLPIPTSICGKRAFEFLEDAAGNQNVSYDLCVVGHLVGKMFEEFGKKPKDQAEK